MDNNIDILLKEINSDIPKINPNLSSKIYEKAIEKKSKNIFPFFKKPLIITFTSVIAVFIVIFGVLNLGRNDNKNDIGNEPQFSPDGNLNVNNNQFVPNLSPTTQNTVFIDYHYTIYTQTDEVVTLIINNKINYQKIYLKAYNLEIAYGVYISEDETVGVMWNKADELMYEKKKQMKSKKNDSKKKHRQGV